MHADITRRSYFDPQNPFCCSARAYSLDMEQAAWVVFWGTTCYEIVRTVNQRLVSLETHECHRAWTSLALLRNPNQALHVRNQRSAACWKTIRKETHTDRKKHRQKTWNVDCSQITSASSEKCCNCGHIYHLCFNIYLQLYFFPLGTFCLKILLILYF